MDNELLSEDDIGAVRVADEVVSVIAGLAKKRKIKQLIDFDIQMHNQIPLSTIDEEFSKKSFTVLSCLVKVPIYVE